MKNIIRSTILTLSFAMLLLPAASTPAAAQGPYYVDLQNNSDVTFQQVYVSPTSDDRWRRDLLGNSVLSPGYSLTVTVPFGQWDFMFVDRNRDACILRNVIVNRDATVSITSQWLMEYCTFSINP
jgi:hypothetical protein